MKFKESYPFAYKNTQLRTVVTHPLHLKEGEVNVTHLSLGTCSGIAWTSVKRSTVSTLQFLCLHFPEPLGKKNDAAALFSYEHTSLLCPKTRYFYVVEAKKN